MKTCQSRLGGAVALSLALLAGCGGTPGGSGVAPAVTPPVAGVGGDISQSVAALLAFISNLINANDENGAPIDVNALTLAVDDAAEPSPVN